MIRIPTDPGSYALELLLPEPVTLQIGRMGSFLFPPGHYYYLGSAYGPGGLRGRILRHLSPPETHKVHWHIDFLRLSAQPLSIYWTADRPSKTPTIPIECRWSQFIVGKPHAFIPVIGFGASDCHDRCPAHLVGFPLSSSHGNVSPASLAKQLAHQAAVEKVYYQPSEGLTEVKWVSC